MKRDKVSIGQCYEYEDKVYMVLKKYKIFDIKCWTLEDTLTKRVYLKVDAVIRKWRRPFENFG